MRFIIFILMIAISPINSFADKGKEIEEFISIQTKIIQIARHYQRDPFKKGTHNLSEAIVSELKALNLENIDTEQLFRLGIACSMAAYPQDAGDESWDLIFDSVAWKCVHIISTRPGYESANYLKRMKVVFGTDGASSLWFDEYIEKHSKLESEQ